MKVKELIEILSSLNQEVEVVIKTKAESISEDFRTIEKSDISLITGNKLITLNDGKVYDCSPPNADSKKRQEYLLSLSGPTLLSRLRNDRAIKDS